jgi:hypothetical protein
MLFLAPVAKLYATGNARGRKIRERDCCFRAIAWARVSGA